MLASYTASVSSLYPVTPARATPMRLPCRPFGIEELGVVAEHLVPVG